MATWRWISDDAGTKIRGAGFDDGTFYAFTGVVPDASRTEAQNNIELRGGIWGILYAARAAFLAGSADYSDACNRLADLIPELFKAQADVEGAIANIFGYLSPGGVDLKLKTTQERISFARECAARLPKPEILKAEPAK
jgi:hypothetical protein